MFLSKYSRLQIHDTINRQIYLYVSGFDQGVHVNS